MKTKDDKLDSISFKVDAGLIDRLGRELVGRAETAVSELIKNSYDADATIVNVEFQDSYDIGGTLIISDNGLGMTLEQLQNGFMTISSTDKIHNPRSVRFERSKAGRKGIGRFATQRLGKKLTIITQVKNADKALSLTINWDDYKIDRDLISIKNEVKEVEKSQDEGTILIIDDLRDWWSEKTIERIYRYVSDLLQPDYLSDRSRNLGLAKQKDDSFKVSFSQTNDGYSKLIADPDKMIFDKSLAIIEGFIDSEHDGYCNVTSNSLELPKDDIISIEFDKENPKFATISGIHFKAYYFIYNREDYYTNISKLELNNIQKISREQGGIKLYRNGFRVLPYGEPNNDWLGINQRYYNDSGTNVPFGNHNIFGFVEIIDSSGALFEETASREGLIENPAYLELREFISKSLEACRIRIRFAVEKIRKEKAQNPYTPKSRTSDSTKSPIEKLNDLEKQVIELINGNKKNNDEESKENVKQAVQELKSDLQNLIDELGMIRVLAGLGLTIGEFTHEVVQFTPPMYGDIDVLSSQALNLDGLNSLNSLKRTLQLFTSYTAYFNSTISANVSRELKSQDLDIVISNFEKTIKSDIEKLNIDFQKDFYGFDLLTIPMHSSEWSSILFNLYTNAKKAIKRACVAGRIKIIVGKEDKNVYVEFLDNGDGIPENNRDKIFEAFFTTSSPVGFDSTNDERLTGTGLGLKIVRDVVQTYGGTIEVISPESGYNTAIRIEIPAAKQETKNDL